MKSNIILIFLLSILNIQTVLSQNFEPFVHTKYADNLYIKEVKFTQSELIITIKYKESRSQSKPKFYSPNYTDSYIITDSNDKLLSPLRKVSKINYNSKSLPDLVDGSEPMEIETSYGDSIQISLHFDKPSVSKINLIEGSENIDKKNGNYWHFLGVHLDKDIDAYIAEGNQRAAGCKAFNKMADNEYRKAVEYFEQCSDYSICHYQIGRLYQFYLRDEVQEEAIISSYEKAIELGSKQAYVNIAYVYVDLGKKQKTLDDYITYEKLAFENAQKAVDNEWVEGYYVLNAIYAKGRAVSRNYTKAQECIDILKSKNWNVEKLQEEFDEYKKIEDEAHKGNKEAVMDFYGKQSYIYDDGWSSRYYDRFKAADYLKNIANENNPLAIMTLATFYMNVEKLEPAKEEAKKFIEIARTSTNFPYNKTASRVFDILMPLELYDECIEYYAKVIDNSLKTEPLRTEEIKNRKLEDDKYELFWISSNEKRIIDTVSLEKLNGLKEKHNYISSPFRLQNYCRIKAEAYQKKGDYQNAIKEYMEYQKYMEIPHKFSDMLGIDGEGYMNAAILYNRLGNKEKANEALVNYINIEKIEKKSFNANYDDGERATGFKIDGKTHGVYTHYHSNGKIYVKANFFLGERDGNWKYYNSDGTPDSEMTYKSGVLDGKYISYNEKGEVSEEGSYKDAKKHAEWITYSTSSNVRYLYIKEKYNEGVLESETSYRSSGRISKVTIKKNNYSEERFYHANGNLSLEMKTNKDEKGVYHRKNRSWASDGMLFAEGNYIDGKKVGTHYVYYEDRANTIKSKSIYATDGKSYQYTSYYKDGSTREKRSFILSKEDQYTYKEHGISIEYATNGNVIAERTYNMGKYETEKLIVDEAERKMWDTYLKDKSKAWGYFMLDLEKSKGLFTGDESYKILDDIVVTVKNRITLKNSYTKQDALAIMNTIGNVLKEKGFIYDEDHIDDYYQCLKNKAIDCDMYACTYLTIADKFNLPLGLVYAPGHAFVKWEDSNNSFYWECTISKEMTYNDYKDWLRFTDYQASTKVYMHKLGRKEALAHAYCLLGLNSSDARDKHKYYTVSRELNPNAYATLSNQYNSLYSDSEKYKTLTLLDNLLGKHTDFSVEEKWGKYYWFSDYRKAIEYYLSAIQCYNKLNEYDKNEEEESYIGVVKSIGSCYYNMGDYKNALIWNKKVYELYPVGSANKDYMRTVIYELEAEIRDKK